MHSFFLKQFLFFLLAALFINKQFAQTATNPNIEKFIEYANAGRMDSAIYFAKILELASKKDFGDTSFEHAVFLTAYLGHAYLVMEDLHSAYHYLKKGVDIFTMLHDTSNAQYNDAAFYFGMVCLSIGSNAEAEIYLAKAAELYKKKEVGNYAQSLLNLASIYANKGEYAKAELLDINVQQILDTVEKTSGSYYLIASSYNNRGSIYVNLGDLEKGAFFIKKGLVYMKEARNLENPLQHYEDEVIKLQLNLSYLYEVIGLKDSANILFKQVEDSLLLNKNDLLNACLLKEKAVVCQVQNNLQQAIRFTIEYKNMADTLLDKPTDYEATVINLGSLYTKTKQFYLADSLLREEEKKLRRSGLYYSYEEQQALLALCANLIDEKKYTEAADSLTALCHLNFTAMDKNFYGMSEDEKLKYKMGLDEIFNLLYISLYNMKAVNKNRLTEIYKLELQRNNLVLLVQTNLFGRLRNSKDSIISALYNTWLNNKQILSRQYSLPVDQRIFNTDSLENICETLEKKVSANDNSLSVPEFHSNFSTDLLNKPLSANIQFIRFNYKTDNNADSVLYAAFINNNVDSTLSFVHVCSEKMIIKMMQDKNGRWIDGNLLTQKLYNGQSGNAVWFYNLIWKPFAPYLKGIKTINYATAGLINNIALHALFDGKNYLTYKFTFHRFFRLDDSGKQRALYQKPQSISLWGDIDYDSAAYNLSRSQGHEQIMSNNFSIMMPGIKATAQTKNISSSALQPFDTIEIVKLKKIFSDHHIPVSSFQKGYATEENFKENSSLIKDVLHISTHGFYTPLDKKKSNELLPGNFISATVNPLFRCGLAFAGVNYYWLKGTARQNHEDGILTGYEVAQLDLHNVQLLTLSACETGLGDVTGNEGNLGLQRAFKLAGVHNMLVSLWQVPAKQTAELLSLFYNNWLNGQTLSVALQNADKEMQKKNYPPYFWAGFVLIE